MIDIVLSGDNAVVVGMAVQKLQGSTRKKAMFLGIAGAVVLRIVFTAFAMFLMGVPYLKEAGGVMLLYVAYKLYKSITQEEDTADVDAKSTFWGAVGTIIVADVSMSIDNVLAVAGAASEHYFVMLGGLALSILLMALAASVVASLLERHKWLNFVGLSAIVFVAIRMILGV